MNQSNKIKFITVLQQNLFKRYDKLFLKIEIRFSNKQKLREFLFQKLNYMFGLRVFLKNINGVTIVLQYYEAQLLQYI